MRRFVNTVYMNILLKQIKPPCNQYHALNAWYAQALQGHITGLRLKTH